MIAKGVEACTWTQISNQVKEEKTKREQLPTTDLPSGVKPPATEEEEDGGLLVFLASKLDRDSASPVVNLLLLPFP